MGRIERALVMLFAAGAVAFSTVADAAGKRQARPARPAVVEPAVVPTVDASRVAEDPELVIASFNRWLDGIEASGDIAGLAAIIVKDDKVLLERGIGFADAARGERVTPTTVFRLASLSKAFAATLAGMLVEQGRLSWDAPIADLLPGFALSDEDGTRRVSVRDVLSHRVGLPHNTYDRLLEQAEPYPLLVERLGEVPLSCPVGECYGYQNIAFSLVGDITYALTGDFFQRAVERRIFHPLGMRQATFGKDALESAPSWARPHRRRGDDWVPFLPNENYYRVAPAAGINASVQDLGKWLMAQMGHRPDVLSPTLLAALQTPQVETVRDTRSAPWRRGRLHTAQYGLGWRIYDYAGVRMVFHAGAVQGYRAMIAFLPEYRFGFAMLWNSESALPAGLLPMLLDRYLGLPEVNWAGLHEDDSDAMAGSGG